MLRYRLIEKTEDSYIYEYFPETQMEHKGIIRIFINENQDEKAQFDFNRKFEIIEESIEDFRGMYAKKACHFIPLGRESGTIAWC